VYRKPLTKTATIASGESTSDVIRTRDYALMGLIFPATMTSTSLAIHVCGTPDGTYVPCHDADDNPVGIPVTAGEARGLSAAEADAVAPFQFLKLVGNDTETGARAIGVALK